jgi:hypothetical protein
LREINRRLDAGEAPDAGMLLGLPSASAIATTSPDRKTLIRSLIAEKVEAWSKE